jgi:hypothetical protein
VSDQLVFDPSCVIKRGGLRIGIVGIASNIVDKSMPPSCSEGVRFTLGSTELPGHTHNRLDLTVDGGRVIDVRHERQKIELVWPAGSSAKTRDEPARAFHRRGRFTASLIESTRRSASAQQRARPTIGYAFSLSSYGFVP